jgi:hypothetical protein
MWAEITSEPSEVINGTYSLKGGNDDTGQTWNEFAHSDTDLLPLDGDSTYTVTFTYKVLDPSHPNGHFYFFARSLTGGVASDIGNRVWQGQTGATDSVISTFTLESYDDYYLVFGLKYTGEYSLDDISIAEGGGGMWRRDFDNGTVVVNPATSLQTVTLGDTLYRFFGQQDPEHNNGEAVGDLTLAGHDAVVLLNAPQGELLPVSLNIATSGSDVVLTWSGSPGATGYYVYRDCRAWFLPSDSNRLTPTPMTDLMYVDEGVIGDPVTSWFYSVTALGSFGVESEPSNRVGEADFATSGANLTVETKPRSSKTTDRRGPRLINH